MCERRARSDAPYPAPHPRPDSPWCLFERQKLSLGVAPQFKFQLALLHGPLADRQSCRDAEQVGIAEFLLRARESVIEQHLKCVYLGGLASLTLLEPPTRILSNERKCILLTARDQIDHIQR
jgi:hypothetical protein